MTDSGGVGGLLMIQSDRNTYLSAYDAMGNLHALMTAGSVTLGSTSYNAGNIVAAYEYDAFGRNLRESGAYAGLNPFRFSTKYTDTETDLVCYGHRYYAPSLGRFINRDPKEEQGGVNLYTFVLNNPINSWDMLGMFGVPDPYGNTDANGNLLWIDGDDIGQILNNLFIALSNRVATPMRTPVDADGRMTSFTSMSSSNYEAVMANTEAILDSRARYVVKASKKTGAGTGSVNGKIVAYSDDDGNEYAKNQSDGDWYEGVTAPNSAASPGIGLPSEAAVVPAGSTGIRIIGANSGNPEAAVADAAATLAYLSQNSPLLDKAVRTVVAKKGYIGIAPVSAASGGRAVSNTAVYGTGIVYRRESGGIIYPAYTLAHEIGHLYDVVIGGTRGQSSLTMTDAQRALAPNVTELYAFNFANQVAAEVRQNTGHNFASPQTYTNAGPGVIAPGPSYPQEQ